MYLLQVQEGSYRYQLGRTYGCTPGRSEKGTYRRQPGGKQVPYHSKNVEGEEARDGHEVF